MPLTPETATRKDRNSGYSEMQHRHFATIAAIIAAMPSNSVLTDRSLTARHFANELARTNPRFDRNRFLRACGVL